MLHKVQHLYTKRSKHTVLSIFLHYVPELFHNKLLTWLSWPNILQIHTHLTRRKQNYLHNPKKGWGWGEGGARLCTLKAYLGNQEARQVDFTDHLAAPVTFFAGQVHIVLADLRYNEKRNQLSAHVHNVVGWATEITSHLLQIGKRKEKNTQTHRCSLTHTHTLTHTNTHMLPHTHTHTHTHTHNVHTHTHTHTHTDIHTQENKCVWE